MKAILSNDYVNFLARVVVGFIFISFGMEKIFEPSKFANEIGNYKMLPEILLNFSALILPWIEVISGLLLIAGVRIKANSAIIGSLLFVFIVAVATAMARGLSIKCGCSSSNAQMVGFPKIFENLGLLLLCLNLFIFPNSRFSFDFLSSSKN